MEWLLVAQSGRPPECRRTLIASGENTSVFSSALL
jgi:hypothetical protein